MPAWDRPWLRPLLGLTRAETRALCGRLAVGFVDDPSNRDRRHPRVRVREELLPVLREQNPRAEAARVRQILLVAAILLVLGYSFGDRPFFTETFGPALSRRPGLARYADLLSYSYWSVAKLLGFGLLPLGHLLLRGERAADYGLGRQPVAVGSGVPRLPWLRMYLLLLVAVLPAVVERVREQGSPLDVVTLADGRTATGTYVMTPVDEKTMTIQLIAHTIDGAPQPTNDPVTLVRESVEAETQTPEPTSK